MITFFFLTIVLLPTFITFSILYTDNRNFEWTALTNMQIGSRRKLLAWIIFYCLVVLLIVVSFNKVFLGDYKGLFATLIMGFVFAVVLSFLLHIKDIKNSLHTQTACLLATFCFIFSWRIPGLVYLANPNSTGFLIAGVVNVVVMLALIWTKTKLNPPTIKEIATGILVGILSPILLTLLTYGI